MRDELLVQREGRRGKPVWVHRNQCKPFCKTVPDTSNKWPEPSGEADPMLDGGQSDDSDSNHSPEKIASLEDEVNREEYQLRPRVAVYYGQRM